MEKRKPKARTPVTRTRSPSPKRNVQSDPTPLDLDHFIPWKFKELQSAQTVIVKRMYQEDHLRRRSTKSAISVRQAESYPTLISTVPTQVSITDVENAILLIICYNRAGQAVDITIPDCSFPIDCKLLQVILLCLPFHTLLNKFTCKGRSLNVCFLKAIAKMLPFSNFTDICLDNTFVPQGNYYILLDRAPLIKCLSLSKCRINDAVVKTIAERLELNGSASKNLRVLCLSYNLITDVGAQALGHALRTNRHLVHLNLCGNSITVVGAEHLLEPLSEFIMSENEIKEKTRRMTNYLKDKAAAALINKSRTSTFCDYISETGKSPENNRSLDKKSLKGSKVSIRRSKLDENIENDHVFGPSNTVFTNDCWHSTGNLTLCSLNLGYNSLDFTILLKIIEVLSYQKDQNRSERNTGLLRIVIEGNDLPLNCEEYTTIETNLALLNNEACFFKKKRKSSGSQKTRRDTSSRNASSVVVLMD